MKKALLLFLLCSFAWASPPVQGQITLHNDSPYILTASVFANSGEYLGQITLQPGQQKNFTSNLYATNLNRPGRPNVSITPYRIIWQCSGGGVYSMCTDGAAGAYVRANACPGQLVCSPKEEQKGASAGAPAAPPPNK